MWREAGSLSPWREPPQRSSLNLRIKTQVGRLEDEVSRLTGVSKPKGGEEGVALAAGHIPANDRLSGRDRTCLRTACVRRVASGIGIGPKDRMTRTL